MTNDEPIRDEVRLRHIMEQIALVENILASDRQNPLCEPALERIYTVIGEACRCVSPVLKSAYPDIPWSDIIAMRNILVHEYYKVKKETLWDVAEHKIPALKDWINGILEQNKNT